MVKMGAREFVYPNFGYRSRWLRNRDPVYCQRYRRALHAGRTAPIGRHSSPALIGHQTLELLRSDWLNLEPLALDNPAVT